MLTSNLDFSGVKGIVIPEGNVYKIELSGTVLWKRPAKNWVPLSTDTDGSIYNGVGYKDNVRLSSSGGVSSSAQTGSATTGFIPFGGDTDIIRIKGAEWLDTYASTGGHYYINFYDANKKFLTGLAASAYATQSLTHVIVITCDDKGVTTFDLNENYGTTNAFLNDVREASYFRLNAYGKGEDLIVTVNEEIA